MIEKFCKPEGLSGVHQTDVGSFEGVIGLFEAASFASHERVGSG